MRRLINGFLWLVGLAVVTVVYFFVPLGRFTLYEHTLRIAATEPAQELGREEREASVFGPAELGDQVPLVLEAVLVRAGLERDLAREVGAVDHTPRALSLADQVVRRVAEVGPGVAEHDLRRAVVVLVAGAQALDLERAGVAVPEQIQADEVDRALPLLAAPVSAGWADVDACDAAEHAGPPVARERALALRQGALLPRRAAGDAALDVGRGEGRDRRRRPIVVAVVQRRDEGGPRAHAAPDRAPDPAAAPLVEQDALAEGTVAELGAAALLGFEGRGLGGPHVGRVARLRLERERRLRLDGIRRGRVLRHALGPAPDDEGQDARALPSTHDAPNCSG